MSATGIIFSNIHDANLPELTKKRTLASVPFGCRYRFIDFALSNMVNSNIFDISVIAHYNYQSLMDHIGSGKDWDLARRSGGIKILPPYITAYANNQNALYTTRLEALRSVSYILDRLTADYVVLSDCDVICNVDFQDLIAYHKEKGADMTMAVKNMKLDEKTAASSTLFYSDESGAVTDVVEFPKKFTGEADVSLNIAVMNTKYLQQIVMDAIAHGYTSLTKDIILRNLDTNKFCVYKHDGYFACIRSFADYFKYSMEVLSDKYARNSLFNVKNRPIFTKVRNSVPTYFSADSVVKNSMIADGCRIEGNVENSVLFRGVKVSRNATVKNSIIMQDTYIGEGTYINCVISDKNAFVRDGRLLSGTEEQPYFISKGQTL